MDHSPVMACGVRIKLATLLGFSLLACIVANTPAIAAITFFGSAGTPADNVALTDAAAVAVTPPASMQVGDLVYVFVHHRTSSGTAISVSQAGGQTWTSEAQQLIASGSGGRVFWCRFNGTWSANPSFIVATPNGTGLSAVMAVFRPTNSSNTWSVDVAQASADFPAPSSPFDVTATGQTTTQANTVTMALLASNDNNSWTLQTAGWSNPTGVPQWRNAQGTGSSQSLAYKIQTSAGATGNVTNRQTALGGDGGRRFVQTFAEVAGGSSGPVGHWKLDEGSGSTTADASGNGHAGTLLNSPAWGSGRVGNALSFNYAGQTSVAVDDTAGTLANLYTTGMTVSAWIKPLTNSSTPVARVVDKDNDSAGWFLAMSGATQVQFTADQFSPTAAKRVSSAVIALNTWQHVAVTWTGSPTASNINIYVNGVLSNGTTTNGSGTIKSDTNTPLTIGNKPNDLMRGFNGTVDEVRIYNRVLSAGEIQALADSTVPSTPTGLTATPVSSTQINLSWTASTDNVGVTGYLVERCAGASCSNFVQVATPAGTTHNDPGLTASTTYRYRVRATDANTNLGAYSSIVNATTQGGGGGDTQACKPACNIDQVRGVIGVQN